jgi:acyl-CoA synthetase (AMP-forming)/AMP-acid ligase II
VAAAAVASVADPVLGEAPAALVVAEPDAALAVEDLRRFCGGLLPPYMVPRVVRFVDDLPRNSVGKLLRERVAQILRQDSSTA